MILACQKKLYFDYKGTEILRQVLARCRAASQGREKGGKLRWTMLFPRPGKGQGGLMVLYDYPRL